MQIQLRSKHLDLTDALKEYAKKKLSRIQKYFDQVLSADVMLSTERNLHLVEVTVHVNGSSLRGEEKTGDMYSSIDKVMDKLERQAIRLKEKQHDHHRFEEELIEQSIAAPSNGNGNGKKIHLKRQRVLPFTPEEAAHEMKRLGFNFYLFQNRETDDLNLIYRRENGNLAVLEPVV